VKQLTFGVEPRGKRRKCELHRDTSAGVLFEANGSGPLFPTAAVSLSSTNLSCWQNPDHGQTTSICKARICFDLLLLPVGCDAEIEELRASISIRILS
jgi:hypothetical protein